MTSYYLPGAQQSSKCVVHCTGNLQLLLQRSDPPCTGVSQPRKRQRHTAAVQSTTVLIWEKYLNVYIFSLTFSARFQGALYCLLGNHSGVCLANLHDWDCIAVTWPAIVRSGLSSAMSLEKPSIVRLFDDLADKIHRQYETIGVDFSVRKTQR